MVLGRRAPKPPRPPARAPPWAECDEKLDVMFKSKAKLIFASKSDDGSTEWKDHGLGMLKLQRPTAPPGEPPRTAQLVLRTENLGKVPLNANLYKGLTTQVRQGKSGKTAEVLMTLFPLKEPPPPPQDGKEPPPPDPNEGKPVAQLTLLRVGSSKLAEELKSAIAANLPA